MFLTYVTVYTVCIAALQKEKWNLLEVIISDAWVKDFCTEKILALQL